MRGFPPKMFLCIALAIISTSSINGLPSAKFPDTARLSESCPDHCKYDALSLSKQGRSCNCDYSCSKFGDCCVDATRLKINTIDTKCYDVSGVGGVYMVGRCPEKYYGVKDWREMCEETEIADPSDPVGTMPITDYETGVTYKNIYCKMCNGRMNLTSFWNPKIECPLLPLFNESSTFTNDFILQNLVMEEGTWGLNINQGVGRDFFLDCFVNPVVPPAFKDKVRYCYPDLVSDCPSDWESEKVRAKCLSYLGPRFTEDGVGYKNLHCAICNGADLAELSCEGPEPEDLDIFRFSTAHSFALLMDINEKMGSRVGMIKMCKDDDVYDPFFQKCRTLQCFPGFMRRGLRCVRRKFHRKIIRRPSIQKTRVASTSSPFTFTTEAPSTFPEIYETTTMTHSAQDGFQSTDSLSTAYIPLSTTQGNVLSSSSKSVESDVTEFTSTTDMPSVDSTTASASVDSTTASASVDSTTASASVDSTTASSVLELDKTVQANSLPVQVSNNQQTDNANFSQVKQLA